MDSLRWALLLIGLVILFAIYFLGRKKDMLSSQKTDVTARDREAPENLDIQVFNQDEFDQIDFNALASGMRLDHESGGNGILSEEKSDTHTDETSEELSAQEKDDRLIVFYLVSKDHSMMKGKHLVDAMEMAGLRYGDMKIFHFHEPDSESKQVLFSAANLTDPGWFDLITIDSLETPGLSLFMQLPEGDLTIAAFDYFVSVIEQLKLSLSAVLKDRKHNTVSPQILSHMRENMVEYERQKKIRKKPD